MDSSTKSVLNAYELYMNKKIEKNLRDFQACASYENKSSSSLAPTQDTYVSDNLFKILSANDKISRTGFISYHQNKSPLSFPDSVELILSMHSADLLSLSYYHQDKPHRILLSSDNLKKKLSSFVLGDGMWLLAICQKHKDTSIEYHLYDVHVPLTNNSDPPLLIINPKISVDDRENVESYLSSRC